MTPAGLPPTIPGLRALITSAKLGVGEALQLQHQAMFGLDRYRCSTHEFPLPRDFPDKALPLAGIGLAHKDIFHMSGRSPDCGMGLPPIRSRKEAAVVKRLRQNGAFVLAALTMSEHACGVTGENPNLPLPVNPIAANAAVGGSSSGSAVAVAAGLCYGSFGTDTAGSVRIPAATCGVIGFKPSSGLLPVNGVEPLAPSLDAVGILARNSLDVAIMFQHSLDQRQNRGLFGDSNASTALSEATETMKQSRLAFSFDHVHKHVALRSDIRAALEHFVSSTAKTARETTLPCFAQIIRYADIVLNVQASGTHFQNLESKTRPIGKLARALTLAGAAIPAGWYLDALNDRARMVALFTEKVFAESDFLVTPILPQGIPDWNAVHTESKEFDSRALLNLFAWTSFANYLGLPAIVLPIGIDETGKPISAQVLARHGADLKLLAFAAHASSALA